MSTNDYAGKEGESLKMTTDCSPSSGNGTRKMINLFDKAAIEYASNAFQIVTGIRCIKE